MADCSPVGRRFAPAPPHAAFVTLLLCRTSSTFANNKFDGYHLKICSTPVSFGPASPDAGVELLRQLFLQCEVWSTPEHFRHVVFTISIVLDRSAKWRGFIYSRNFF